MSNLPKLIKRSSSNFKYSIGQVLLLVLLSMAIILTLGLSVLSRSVTNTAVSTKEEEALRAFSAAEAGVERALVTKSDTTGAVGNSQYSVNVSSYGTGVTEYMFPTQITSGESLTLWLVSHADDGSIICDSLEHPCFTGDNIKVCWGTKGVTPSGDAQTPALEITVAYTDAAGYTNVKIARDTMDYYSSRTPPNHFGNATSANCNIGGTEFAFEKTFALTSLGIYKRNPSSSQIGPQFARFRIFYNTVTASPVGITTNDATFPAQGVRIESTGVSGESNRRLEVFQGYGEPPSIFDAAIFSVGGITQ